MFGSRVLPVKHEDGKTGEVTVKQLKLRDYQVAYKLLDDEIGLTAFICGLKKEEIEKLHPESYETVFAAANELNAGGFFTYADRQAERAAENLKLMPKEIIEKLISSRLSASSRLNAA